MLEPPGLSEKLQRRAPAPSLAVIASRYHSRDESIVAVHASGASSYSQIAEHFGLHPGSVGKIVRRMF